jgi:TolB-like protein
VKIANFFGELKRRNVYKVAVAYAVAGWALAQGIAQVFPVFDIPNWAVRLIVLVIMIGFPIALVIAWAFELTPEGIKRTEDADLTPSAQQRGKRAWIFVVIIAGAVSLTLFFLGRYTARNSSSVSSSDLPAKSIAVLPFVNMSSDKENEYFVDGLTEEILNRVAQITDLKVPGRTSSFAFKGKNSDLRQIGAALGVAHVLEGSVRKSADRLRITAQLMRTADGYHLWSQSYDRKLDDVFAIQEDIARAIADALSVQLKLRSEKSQQPTRDMVAYNQYLEARSLITQRSADNLRRAIGLLEATTQRDADFGNAWAALAQAHALAPYFHVVRLKESHEAAETAARRALLIDDSLAAAHSALADVLRDRYDWLNSEREYQRALQLSPNEVEAHNQYAQMLLRVGHTEAALEHASRACELDPLAWVPPSIVAAAHLSRGELEQARAFLERSEKLVPAPGPLHIILKLLYALSVRDIAAARQTLALARSSSDMMWANAANQKLIEAAQRAIDAFNSQSGAAPDLAAAVKEAERIGGVNFYVSFAAVAVAVNQRGAALDALDGDLHSPFIVDLPLVWMPPFHQLQNKPRFLQLLRETKMPEYWRVAGWGDFCRAKGADDFECGAP